MEVQAGLPSVCASNEKLKGWAVDDLRLESLSDTLAYAGTCRFIPPPHPYLSPVLP